VFFDGYDDGVDMAIEEDRWLRFPVPEDLLEDEPITIRTTAGSVTSQQTLNGSAPVPVLGDLEVECEAAAGTQVVLDGSASFDPDGDTLVFGWYAENGVELDDDASPTPSGLFPL